MADREERDKPLAGKSTLNRLELGTGQQDRYKKITFWKNGIDELLVSVFVESHARPPEQIILDVDTTDLPLHGKQEGRFFHGYYDSYCYLPLYTFCGEHVLCARLRQSNSDASAGSDSFDFRQALAGFERHGRKSRSSCVPTPGSAGTR